jgi:uncharacterized protein (TIGR03790 family)
MIALLLAFTIGCSSRLPPGAGTAKLSKESRVLVVVNARSEAGKEIAHFYMHARNIGSDDLLTLDTTTSDDIPYSVFKSQILAPVRERVATDPQIQFIVLTKGVPIRLADNNRFSVDGQMVVASLANDVLDKLNAVADEGVPNPYQEKKEHFSHEKFGIYLVTRLDGYDAADAEHLVTNSLGAKKEKGLFLFDDKAYRAKAGYGTMQESLEQAGRILKSKGFVATTDRTQDFLSPHEELAGYASWGSNDEAFDIEKYRALRFRPGALAETFVSTSARTFTRTTGGQSLIADLIHQGVTGVKGYVHEPYTTALARPHILFDRYTSGFNLAESFYMASPVIKWKDVVIGDPLCSPYSR